MYLLTAAKSMSFPFVSFKSLKIRSLIFWEINFWLEGFQCAIFSNFSRIPSCNPRFDSLIWVRPRLSWFSWCHWRAVDCSIPGDKMISIRILAAHLIQFCIRTVGPSPGTWLQSKEKAFCWKYIFKSFSLTQMEFNYTNQSEAQSNKL